MSEDWPDLFDDPPHARRSDPDTSHDAVPVNITQQAWDVLQAYRDGAVLIDEQAYWRVGMEGHQRCSDLRQRGLIVDTRMRGRTQKGKSAMLCRITQAGLDWIASGGGKLPPVLSPAANAEIEVEDDVEF